MEIIKTAWEAFKSDMKIRLEIAIGLTIFLLCRPYIEQLPGGKSLFSTTSILVLLTCIIFWVSIIIELGYRFKERYRQKRTWKLYVKYILNLSDDKFMIVNELYKAPHHQASFKYNDTNVRELIKMGIIKVSQTCNIIPFYENNDPTFNFLLTETALQAIDENYDKFER